MLVVARDLLTPPYDMYKKSYSIETSTERQAEPQQTRMKVLEERSDGLHFHPPWVDASR